MRRIATIVLLFGLFAPTLLMGQGETSNWYFGNGAGITFNEDGSVTPLTNGKINTFEGCATISDSFGQLLFYTDGIIVYNQDHLVMQNGNGLFGDPSSTQSALIIPQPGNPDIFLVFTVDTKIGEGDPDRGLNYSVVDMSMNDGKGSVVQKNIPLLADCSEKIAAVVKDCSDQSIWLVTFASVGGAAAVFDTFHAFEINTTGVVRPSIKTTFDELKIEDPRGYLKISPDGKKLANANMAGGLFIYDFDARTGTVSKQQKVFIPGGYTSPYGLEFSPNNQFLYVHASNDTFAESGHKSSLVQYDLMAPELSDSQVIIDSRDVYRGALQLGDNGKIYRTTAKHYFQGTPFLSVINNPNQKGNAANYVHEAISLNGKNATQGLPPFIQSFFNKKGLITNQDGTTSNSLQICAGEGFTLEVESVPGGIYMWEKDGEVLSNSGNILDIPIPVGDDAGKYRLTITTTNPADCPIIGEALVHVAPLPPTSSLILEQCDIDSDPTDGITLINLEQATNGEAFEFTFYESVLDQMNDNHIENPKQYTNTVGFSQTILYKATNELGCEDTGELLIHVNPTTISPSTVGPFVVCDNTSEDNLFEGTFDLDTIKRDVFANNDVAFYKSITDVSLEENPLVGSFTTTNTTLYVRIENDNQCQGVETIELFVQPLPEITLETSYQVCTDGEPITIEAPLGFDSYSWFKIEDQGIQEVGTAQQVSIADGGTYSLEVGSAYESNGEQKSCYTSLDFFVVPSNRAVYEEIRIDDFSKNNSITVMASGDGAYEYSLDGVSYQDDPLFEDVVAGFYTLFTRDKNGCGISEEDIAVVGFPKFFTPNGDGRNDTWQLIGASDDLAQGNITIYDRYGKLLKQMGAVGHGWDGTLNGDPLPASDYWFRVFIDGGKQFAGHFTLKR